MLSTGYVLENLRAVTKMLEKIFVSAVYIVLNSHASLHPEQDAINFENRWLDLQPTVVKFKPRGRFLQKS